MNVCIYGEVFKVIMDVSREDPFFLRGRGGKWIQFIMKVERKATEDVFIEYIAST